MNEQEAETAILRHGHIARIRWLYGEIADFEVGTMHALHDQLEQFIKADKLVPLGKGHYMLKHDYEKYKNTKPIAASDTLAWATSALSTSAVPSRCPETLITSSTRPVIQ